MSFEVIKWVYNKTFVEIMKNTAYFPKKWKKYIKIAGIVLSAARASLGSSGDGIEEVGILPIKLRENKKSDVKVGADECFLIVTFIFQTILNLVVVHLR